MEKFKFHLVKNPLESSPPHPKLKAYGGMVEFLGVVRPTENKIPIRAINYEAYSEMAKREARKIFNGILKKYPISHIQVFHRVGQVPVGKISLRVRVYATHRKEAFEACSEFIEKLKKDVPIWKNPIPSR